MELRTAWHGVVDGRTMHGIARTISKKEGFTDHLIHHQDIRRPLGRPRSIPTDEVSGDGVATLEERLAA